MFIMFHVILGRKIAIITNAFDHELRHQEHYSVGKTPMGRLLEALNSKEVDLSDMNCSC